MSELRVLKQRYLTYLETEWGGSAKMVENYDRYLERFISFAKVKKPSDITAERVASFRLYLTKQAGAKVGDKVSSMKQLTQNYYLIALRMFLKYLIDEGFETMPPLQIKLAKVPKRSLDLISTAELDRLRAAPDQKTIEGKQDHAIIELLCSAGLRISELCALSRDEINLAANEFSVPNARGVHRMVFLSDTARRAIASYLQARKDSDQALFIRYGRKANDGGDLRIHPRAVQRMLKVHAASAGVTSTVTPHILRHTFADSLLQNGADIRSVQALLGHTTVATTQAYRPTSNP
jgi:integrase/recombinase XerD